MTRRPPVLAVLGGLLLGIASRVEERSAGLSLGVSSDAAWVLAGFLAGALVTSRPRGAALGVLALLAANLGYYALIAVLEPARPLGSVAGPVEGWLAVGLLGGGVFGGCGAWWRASGRPLERGLAVLPLACVFVGEAVGALREGGHAWSLVGLAVGVALPALAVGPGRPRAPALAAGGAVLLVGLTGAFAPLLA